MARLKQLKPMLAGLTPRITTQRDQAGHSIAAEPWRRWYKTARWQALRMAVFLRDRFTCRNCKRIEGRTALLVCDHVRPHRGNEALFWADANLQTLCKGCHDGWKQQVEKRGRW